jgi:hypothetical protein
MWTKDQLAKHARLQRQESGEIKGQIEENWKFDGYLGV